MKILTLLLSVIFFQLPAAFAESTESRWPLHIYNFGGYDKFTIAEQVSMTKAAGYAGMIVGIRLESLDTFDDYLSEASKTKDFDIHATFYALYDKVGGLKPNWEAVIDKVKESDINLWLITGKASDKVSRSDLKKSISDFVSYANKKGVPVSLYPHSTNMIDHAEKAVRMIEDLKPLKMDLAFILCHEMRYGNAHRIEEVIQNVKSHIGHVVLSGSDENVDPKTMENSSYEMRTLQPLYQGNFDMSRVLKELSQIGYQGKMGYINHRFEKDKNAWNIRPSEYVEKSLSTYNGWLKALDRTR